MGERGGLMVVHAAFNPRDPGSSPGCTVALFLGKEYLPLFPLLLLHFGIVSALEIFQIKNKYDFLSGN